MTKLVGLLILGAAVYAALNVSTLGLLAGLGGSIICLAVSLALLGSR